nr:hypothetical protein [Micromonospora sp. DSM 115978]
MPGPEDVPSSEQLDDWLARGGHPAEWAASLTGLPWLYVKPVVTIATGTGVHPIAALTAASAYSRDEVFKAAAAAHLDRLAETRVTGGPNRAERRRSRRKR